MHVSHRFRYNTPVRAYRVSRHVIEALYSSKPLGIEIVDIKGNRQAFNQPPKEDLLVLEGITLYYYQHSTQMSEYCS